MLIFGSKQAIVDHHRALDRPVEDRLFFFFLGSNPFDLIRYAEASPPPFSKILDAFDPHFDHL